MGLMDHLYGQERGCPAISREEFEKFLHDFMQPKLGETEREVALNVWHRYDAAGNFIGGRSEYPDPNPRN